MNKPTHTLWFGSIETSSLCGIRISGCWGGKTASFEVSFDSRVRRAFSTILRLRSWLASSSSSSLALNTSDGVEARSRLSIDSWSLALAFDFSFLPPMPLRIRSEFQIENPNLTAHLRSSYFFLILFLVT